jgi:hypothetical protein
MCHTLRYTGARHEQWYGDAKPCCMCSGREYWRHVRTCKSLDAELIRSYSWSKLRKMMDKWILSADMLISMENGIQPYTLNLLKCDPENMPADPPPPLELRFTHQKID